MAALTDEILMAYADGVLDKETRSRLEVLLHQDAESRRRVEMFRMTGPRLSECFEDVMHEPVPDHLRDFVLNYGNENKGSAPASRKHARPGLLQSWGERLFPAGNGFAWQLAAASAAALVIGTGAGWISRGEIAGGAVSSPLAALKGGQILASGPFYQILESAPSNSEVRVSGTAQNSTIMRVSLTFKSKDGGYCREYDMAITGEGQASGLACRTPEGNWAIEVHAAQINHTGNAVPHYDIAGNEKVVDPVVERMIDGDALGKDEEAAAIATGWK